MVKHHGKYYIIIKEEVMATTNPLSVASPHRIQADITDDSLLSAYFGALVMSGADSMDDTSYFRLYNSLHRLDYFNPHVANGIHIFMTRPYCAFTANNLGMDSSSALAASSLEGCLMLASLMPPYGNGLFPTDENNITHRNQLFGTNPATGAKELEYANALWTNVERNGLNKLRGTPFIPLVSNLSDSISGMQDFIMEKYDYDGDQAGNITSDAKGMNESTSSGQVTIGYGAETSNISVTMMHYLWMMYMDKTGKGLMQPCQDSLEYLYYDYMSSIYWFVTGTDGFSIKLYGKLTGVFPINLPITSLVPSKRGSPAEPAISITYHYNHAEIMNPEIIYDFNYTVESLAKAKHVPGGERLENQVSTFNSKLEKWKEDNFLITWENVANQARTQERNRKYNRLMPTGKDDSGKVLYENGIFYPDPQNQWVGHPWVYDGKLVYRSL